MGTSYNTLADVAACYRAKRLWHSFDGMIGVYSRRDRWKENLMPHLWIGTDPNPDRRLQVEVSEDDAAKIPGRGTRGTAGATVRDVLTGRQLIVRRASCGIPRCMCALALVRWLD
jgi:hypothetical protein